MLYTIKILLSTYNGETYIEEQINSLLNQKGVKVDIDIRDDGSTDTTPDILKQYESKNENIHVSLQENIGPSASYMELLYNAMDGYDYYAFSDQDDIWQSEKLLHAINIIGKKISGDPTLYYSALMTFNDDTDFKKLVKNKREYSFEETFIHSHYPGCTMVFNKQAFDLVRSVSRPRRVIMHDLFMAQVIMGTGYNIIYDEESYINYRIHGRNVSVKPKTIRGKIKRLKAIIVNQKGLRFDSAYCTYESLKEVMNDKNRNSLETVISYKDSFKNKKLMIDLISHTSFDILTKLSFTVAVLFNIY